jgi:hypothetical protein
MSVTVDDIQSKIAGVVDQDQDTSNISSTDYALRLNYLNRRERMWAEAGKWQSLVREYNTLTSTISGNTSISLPSDYRSLAIYPEITFDGSTTEQFTEIRPQEEGRFDPVSDRYVKIMGNPYLGYTMVVNSANSNRQLVSGASIKVLYFSTPASMTSPADIPACPNPDYLIQGVIADIWEAQEDARFQAAKVEANIILQNMLEFEFTPSESSHNRLVKTIDETRFNYRWGR